MSETYPTWVNPDQLAEQAEVEADIGPFIDQSSLGYCLREVGKLDEEVQAQLRERLHRPIADQN